MRGNTKIKKKGCTSVSSGQIAMANVSVAAKQKKAEKKCFHIKHAHKRQYFVRVAVEPIAPSLFFDNVLTHFMFGASDTSKHCRIIINGVATEKEPYESINGELIFVFKTMAGQRKQHLLIKCNDIPLPIASVAVFDDILKRKQSKSITVGRGKSINVLFASFDDRQDIIKEMDKNAARKLLDKDVAFVPETERQTDSQSISATVIFQNLAPDIQQKDFISSVVSLDFGSEEIAVGLDEVDKNSKIAELPSGDYLFHFENKGDKAIECIFESTVIEYGSFDTPDFMQMLQIEDNNIINNGNAVPLQLLALGLLIFVSMYIFKAIRQRMKRGKAETTGQEKCVSPQYQFMGTEVASNNEAGAL